MCPSTDRRTDGGFITCIEADAPSQPFGRRFLGSSMQAARFFLIRVDGWMDGDARLQERQITGPFTQRSHCTHAHTHTHTHTGGMGRVS
mmetsp:Transcript_17359/g.49237  ORF Transcript_17359/g.49237 Transcript_17359/m.49237 type:complete len:89 (+) Transcript_17359:1122-1388(+)